MADMLERDMRLKKPSVPQVPVPPQPKAAPAQPEEKNAPAEEPKAQPQKADPKEKPKPASSAAAPERKTLEELKSMKVTQLRTLLRKLRHKTLTPQEIKFANRETLMEDIRRAYKKEQG